MLRGLIVVALLALAGCATPTPYASRPVDGAFGYREQAIEAGRVRVSFRGNELTPRETVEDYLLFRAAELTLEQGFDHFLLATRATDEERRAQSIGPSPAFRSMFDYALYGPSFGWRGAYDPFWDDLNVRETTRFEASAEVVMARGPKPADNPQAFDARDVVATLGPRVVRPPAP
jgi:hypothetical protein